jgi:hypothetical protein
VSDEERLARMKMAEAFIGLGLSLWCLWLMIPQHRRQLWRMRVLAKCQQSTGSAARRAGAGSMRAELASGQENYALPYGLSLAREQLTAAYDRARGITP